jgi:hypothetical protein
VSFACSAASASRSTESASTRVLSSASWLSIEAVLSVGLPSEHEQRAALDRIVANALPCQPRQPTESVPHIDRLRGNEDAHPSWNHGAASSARSSRRAVIGALDDRTRTNAAPVAASH